MTSTLDPLDLAPSAANRAAHLVLNRLVTERPGIRGALVATNDGRPVAAVLPHHDVASTSAIIAASLGLGTRLADLTGEGALQEIVVRSGSGYVVIYAVGDRGVLTVLTSSSVNLALLHLRAREAGADLIEPLARHLADIDPTEPG